MSRYNSRLQRTIKKLLPDSLKESYQESIDESTIRKWEKQGRPLPPPHIAKVRTIARKQAESGYHTLVESGTFLGDMIDAQMKNFNKIYSIELSDELFQKAVEKYRGNEKVQLLNGDSGKVLRDIVPNLKEPAIFWLDGHYSGGITAKGEKICPIYAELDAILQSNLPHMILIDDARLFVGKDDYPTIEDLKSYVDKSEWSHSFEKEDDTLILKRIDESAA